MESSTIAIIGAAVVALVGLVKILLSGGGSSEKAAETMGRVAQSVRKKLTEWKKKDAKEKHDDASDSSIDDWLDDQLGPKP